MPKYSGPYCSTVKEWPIADRQLRVRHLMSQVRRLNRMMHGRIKPMHLDVSVAQLTVLRLMAESGPMRMSDVAREVGLSASSVTGLFDRLEAEGFIERRRSREDRREVTVLLTAQAHHMLEEANARIVREVERLFAPLTDEDLETITRLIAKLAPDED